MTFPIGADLGSSTMGAWPVIVSSIINGIELIKNPDIFITGHQSGFVRAEKNPFYQDSILSLNFIASVNPDAFVCSVNPAYTNKKVEQIVSIIKNIFQKEILFFTLSKRKIEPKVDDRGSIYLTNELIDDQEWHEIAAQLYDNYNIPVVDPLDNSHAGTIADLIVNFFQEKTI